jgi:CheY-like chemotaxis protein
MGGAISARSRPGEGSTFQVVLPLAKSPDAELSTVALPTAAQEPAGKLEIRVLAAEDNAVNQLVLTTLLQQFGVEPTVVENGEAALAAWREGVWDVILMDMQMPVMDGLTAARRIREAEAAAGRARTPIVALSADAMAHQVSECLAAGMDGHVAKPIEAARLFAALEAVLAGAAPASAVA